jgi:hypothetical protein
LHLCDISVDNRLACVTNLTGAEDNDVKSLYLSSPPIDNAIEDVHQAIKHVPITYEQFLEIADDEHHAVKGADGSYCCHEVRIGDVVEEHVKV